MAKRPLRPSDAERRKRKDGKGSDQVNTGRYTRAQRFAKTQTGPQNSGTAVEESVVALEGPAAGPSLVGS